MNDQTVDAVEQVLREELVRGDAILASAKPILRHLLANDDHALFSDELIARIRGMMTHLASQLLFAQAEAAGAEHRADYVAEREDALAMMLFDDTAFLAHAHARTIEAQLTERLQTRSGIDAVLSPLVQRQTWAAAHPTTRPSRSATMRGDSTFSSSNSAHDGGELSKVALPVAMAASPR